ncbi:fimbrillin family protein [Porphyromonas crevioricanis]|uniref:Fimbrillin family protein n=1 Tax=Porphyromonas crevioricanis TaxID=393921 RepID=A0AB34PGK4_9PORP|nr:fimbrillin family protein [Porphyromonas crevioricanis]KGN95429.1 hypothetical protein HQ38_03910 [Porphyromonas crevioricanis]
MNKKVYWAAALLLALTACDKENEPTIQADGPVAAMITAEIAVGQTRASGVTWSATDAIGISTVDGTKTNYANIPYARSGDSFAPVGTVIYFQSPDEVTFNAYYPFTGTSGTAAGTIEATTTADKQTAEEQPKIDFLFAGGAKASKVNPTVAFTNKTSAGGSDNSFHHRMSQIVLKLTEGSDMSFAGKLTEYTLEGLVLEGTFNTATGEAAAKSGATSSALTMTLANVTATSGLYTTAPVIIFPQTVAGGRLTLKVKVDGETYTATLTLPGGATALVAGNNYIFPVTVRKTGLSIGATEIAPWVDVTGDNTDALM